MTIVTLPNGTIIETPSYAEAQRRRLCFWCGEQGIRYLGDKSFPGTEGSTPYQCPRDHIFFVEHQYRAG